MIRKILFAKNRPRSKGQAMVEFALTILLFLILLLAVVEFGRMLQVWVTMQRAAQTGARFAATGQLSEDPLVDPWDSARLAAVKAEVQQACKSLAIGYGGPDTPRYFNVSVYASDSPDLSQEFPGGPNARVIVDVVYNYEPVTPFLQGFAPYLRLTAHAEKINERFRHPGYGTPAGELPPTVVTPTPTPTSTPTPTPTSTSTNTPTVTETPEGG